MKTVRSLLPIQFCKGTFSTLLIELITNKIFWLATVWLLLCRLREVIAIMCKPRVLVQFVPRYVQLLLIIGILFLSPTLTHAGQRYTIDWTKQQLNGWRNPLGTGVTLVTNTAYDFDSSEYPYLHPECNYCRHAGVDIHAEVNDLVYAIASGEVVMVTRGANPRNMVVIVRHTGSREPFFCVYGHIYAASGIREGVRVTAGQPLGRVRKFGSPTHLHFGINISNNLNNLRKHSCDGGFCGWGTVASTVDPRSKGWVDPIAYLATTTSSSPSPVSATPVLISVLDPAPKFRKGCYSGDPCYWWQHSYQGHVYLSTYVGGMSWRNGSSLSPDAWAEFRPYLSVPGQYDVYVYFFACQDTSTRVVFEVHHARGIARITVNQYSFTPKWKKVHLGRWWFSTGPDAFVRVTDATGERYDGRLGLTIGGVEFVPVP